MIRAAIRFNPIKSTIRFGFDAHIISLCLSSSVNQCVWIASLQSSNTPKNRSKRNLIEWKFANRTSQMANEKMPHFLKSCRSTVWVFIIHISSFVLLCRCANIVNTTENIATKVEIKTNSKLHNISIISFEKCRLNGTAKKAKFNSHHRREWKRGNERMSETTKNEEQRRKMGCNLIYYGFFFWCCKYANSTALVLEMHSIR